MTRLLVLVTSDLLLPGVDAILDGCGFMRGNEGLEDQSCAVMVRGGERGGKCEDVGELNGVS